MMKKIVLMFLIFFSASLALSETALFVADPDNLSIAQIKISIAGVEEPDTYPCLHDSVPYRTKIIIPPGSTSPVSLKIPITGFKQGTPILIGLGRDSSIQPKNNLSDKSQFSTVLTNEVNYGNIPSGVRGVITPNSSTVSINVTNWNGDYFLIYACQDKDGDGDCGTTYVETDNPNKNEVASLTIESDAKVKLVVENAQAPPTFCLPASDPTEERVELPGWDEWIIWPEAPVIKDCQTVPQCKAQLDLDFLDQVFDKKKNR